MGRYVRIGNDDGETGRSVRDRGGRDPVGIDISGSQRAGNKPERGAEAPPDIAAAATVSVTMALVVAMAAAAVASTAASATADGSGGDSSGSDSSTGSSSIGDCSIGSTGSSSIGDCSIGDCGGVCSGGNGCIGNGGISCDGNGGDRDGDCGGSDVSNCGDGNVCEADLSPRRNSNTSVALADGADKPRLNCTVSTDARAINPAR